MLSFAKTAGRVTTILVVLACAHLLRAQTQPIQYYYDDLGRLVTMVDSSGNVVTYVYDAVGNILQITRSTVTPGSLAIFDFNPERGPVGLSVTIRGQGFSATESSDIVKFNGVTATVTSATTTTLVATVPVGATTGPISVTVSGQTVTSSGKFVVTQAPVIQSVQPKSALFNVVIPNFRVTGVNLVGATFAFSPPGPTITAVSIDPSGTSATMTVATGVAEGTFALVATTSAGNSGAGTTQANWFTVVNPVSMADSDGDGWPDVVEAAYGTDPLNPNSYPNVNTPPLSGEIDGLTFSVLNTAAPKGSQDATMEADAIPFSVLSTAPRKGSQDATMEADGIPFSVLNTAPPKGSQDATMEADGIPFSVLNTAPPKGSQDATVEADGVFFSVCNSGTSCKTSQSDRAHTLRGKSEKEQPAQRTQHDEHRQKLP
jgi:YD repeat-containing protein